MLHILNPCIIVEMEPASVFSIGITLVDVQSQLVPLPYFSGRSTRCSDRLHDFSVPVPRCYKDPYDNSFFSPTGKSWDYLPIECFHLTYDLNGFKATINKHLLTVGSL